MGIPKSNAERKLVAINVYIKNNKKKSVNNLYFHLLLEKVQT